MLDFLSTAMGFESFFFKSQLSPNDHELLQITKEFQGTYTQFKELERTNDPAYLSLTRSIIAIKSKIEKRLEEINITSCASSLGPFYVHMSHLLLGLH